MAEKTFDPNATQAVPSEQRPYSRGGPWFRWWYARWRQFLAFFDLLGPDGRPSATKLMAFGITNAVIATALNNAAVKLIFALDAKPEAVATEVEVWSWTMFWLIFLCLCVMFGRWGLAKFSEAIQGKLKGPLGE